MAEVLMDENTPYSDSVKQQHHPRMERIVSQNFHRRFPSVEAFVSELGGSKKQVITKILIANNGVAAVKAIRSIRKWAYDLFGNDRAISFVVMATPEDMRANAEYIRMADVIVDVPGGSNNHNYANVTLIVELARLHGVHAVWAGWGHASENPALPDTLAKSKPYIKFIGPAGAAMRALGDKIGSTIIAQTAGVPCIRWNGEHVMADYDRASGKLPDQALEDASIATASDAEVAAAKIGFPVMIKASEGGGGKGIRMVQKEEDVANAFRQVCGEVPGSPIFIMKLSSNSRHLEVQLLADEYGEAVALNGRDCSVQRRHQKIIEEGPPIAAKAEVWSEMEKAAVALAKAVQYTNAGTVEYLYSEPDSKFFFLELNPRLQVEHPVTEMITRVNLPAAQLQVAMGIPLHNIPEIRELYGKNRFEDELNLSSAKIDFEKTPRVPPNGHCIAVRITAENAEAGFKPTSGCLQELNFRSTPNVWGYFSMDSSGSVHEFADSQFGHLFASGADREQARRNMVLGLKELSIRGDISTTVDYISKLIELEDFVANNIDTGWLDKLISQNVNVTEASENFLTRSESSVKINTLHSHIYVVTGATILAYERCIKNEKTFLELLEKGQLPARSLLKLEHEVELILNGVKYVLVCTRNGANSLSISLANDRTKTIGVNVRLLSDGGYLIELGGASHVGYLTTRGDAGTGMRISVGGTNVAFSPDYDPSTLRTDVAGKLVKKLKGDGSRVKKGEAYAEIEVMKMFMPLKVEESGVLTWEVNEGASLSAGDLLGTLELDNPENVAQVSVFNGDLTLDGRAASVESTIDRPHLLLRASLEKLNAAISGFILNCDEIDSALSNIARAVVDPTLPLCEVEEQVAVLSGRIPGSLMDAISNILIDFRSTAERQAGTGVQLRFPALEILALLTNHSNGIKLSSEKSAFEALISCLKEAAIPYTRSLAPGVPGSERVLQSFIAILRKWISVERYFCDGRSYADAIESLRKTHKADPAAVFGVCRAHEQLPMTTDVIIRIISAIADGSRINFETNHSAIGKRLSVVAGADGLAAALPAISEIGSMGSSDKYAEVALKARKLLMQESMPSLEQRTLKVMAAVQALSNSTKPVREFEELLADHIPMVDVFLPLLRTVNSESERIGLLELHVKHLYRPYTIKSLEKSPDEGIIKFSFLNKASESLVSASTSVTSMTDLTRMVSSGSLTKLSDDSDSVGDGSSSLLTAQNNERIPPSAIRVGIEAIINSLDDVADALKFESILSRFPQFSGAAPVNEDAPVNVLYLIVLGEIVGTDEESHEVLAQRCEDVLEPYQPHLLRADIRRLSFVFEQDPEDNSHSFPALFTYRYPDFHEDSLFRQIDPSLAIHLDLNRVAANFKIKSIGSRQSTTCYVHLYEAIPRSAALIKDKLANRGPRIFARTLSFAVEFSSAGFERILVDALNAFDLSPPGKSDNHLFLNLLSDFDRAVIDPVVVEQVVVEALKRHGDRVSNLGIVEVEVRIVCCLSGNTPPIAIRLFASNPTGFVHVMNSYVEAVDNSGERVFKLISGTKANLASAGDSSWDGKGVNIPYPLTRPFDAQRKAALRASDTLYCYDLPALFEAAVEQQWSEAAKVTGGMRNASRPLMVMYTTELVVKKKDGSVADPWTMSDYLNGGVELSHMHRGAGANNVGMVAWLVVLKTLEYPNGRQVVLIANDITHKAGSFGTREDVVFKMASEYAREMRIPRLYIAANSGARIGLADSVQKLFKVAFKDSGKPESGFDFLYVTKGDYNTLTHATNEVIAEPAAYEGLDVYRITDIIGSEPDLGVENLKGSGLIAGETSAAYEDIFTMTIVLGRTVGIGAYLVRLGQRTIQKSSASPIILTGYQALNKLMGVDVYQSNDQLGGPGIMYSNGISHLVEPDHLRAVRAAIDWISFVPSTRGGMLPITDIRGIDEVERPITFCPKPGVPYDPRCLLAGGERDDGVWESGFFDKGSFKETLAGWAKTVVCGRARLGGIPMGVIITENRTAEAVKPADPADVSASEAVIQEAGCVWFPNSAYKTAQAIKDFRTEDLPLIVFANWRGFSGGQRDMFDEVLKYGSLIVDAFVSYEQPVFIFIPPFAEIRGGAWVVLDASINSAVMEMYAAKGSARGGVLEASGAASVKYRTKDLVTTMHRLDEKLQALDKELTQAGSNVSAIKKEITQREHMLLPVYEQIAVKFCELHDTPGRMKAVGVIHREVDWSDSRSIFYWRLRRKLAEFDLRKKINEAAQVGRGVIAPTPNEASALIKQWFQETHATTMELWDDDKAVLSWMSEQHKMLEQKIIAYTKETVVKEVVQVMTAGGNTARIGTAGIIEGLGQALQQMSAAQRKEVKAMLADLID
ncbi:hypothetical protein MPSEU_000250900 [Mayamaea pseudoterrestris]|nr:hypothetical protein MPSEU_000250900 [Mayamaea pseudoterrestris]